MVKTKWKYVIAVIGSIGLGFLIQNPWIFFTYLIIIVLPAAGALVIIIYSLIKKTKEWKLPLFFLTLGCIAALTSYCFTAYKFYRYGHDRNNFVLGLYNYRYKHGHFPKTVNTIALNTTFLRGSYAPDSALKNFTLSTKDVYGFPFSFTSKDSTWSH